MHHFPGHFTTRMHDGESLHYSLLADLDLPAGLDHAEWDGMGCDTVTTGDFSDRKNQK